MNAPASIDMTTIEEFQREASQAFESDAAVNVITEIKLSRHRQEPEFKVILSSPTEIVSGHAKTPGDAIRECKRARAQEIQDRFDAAKKIFGIL